jgi:hypothetical protein
MAEALVCRRAARSISMDASKATTRAAGAASMIDETSDPGPAPMSSTRGAPCSPSAATTDRAGGRMTGLHNDA